MQPRSHRLLPHQRFCGLTTDGLSRLPLATLPPVPSVLWLLWTLAAPNTPLLSALPLHVLFLLLRLPALPSIHQPICLAKRCSTSGPVTTSLFFSLTSPPCSVLRVFCSHLHYNWGGFGGRGGFYTTDLPRFVFMPLGCEGLRAGAGPCLSSHHQRGHGSRPQGCCMLNTWLPLAPPPTR